MFPWFGVIFVSAFIFLFALLSNGSSDAISFLILVGSVFWMISYILAHINVLILRKRLPKAPRSFKSSMAESNFFRSWNYRNGLHGNYLFLLIRLKETRSGL